jgi:crotonobetainyl-CoA:carnitine CoA-transferase CaiB-like acyl-CoA transferase
MAGVAAALAALVGLRRRRETGRGGLYDCSQLDVFCSLLGTGALDPDRMDPDPVRSGPLVRGFFRCAGPEDDNWIAIDAAAEQVTELIDIIEASIGPTAIPSSDPGRLDEAIGRLEKSELAERLQARGIAAFPLLRPGEVISSPHIVDRRLFTDTLIGGQTMRLPGTPLSSRPPLTHLEGRAPRPAHDTRRILRQVIGCDDSHITDLVARGIIRTRDDSTATDSPAGPL